MNEDERLKQFNDEHDKIYSSPPLDLQNQGTAGQAPGGPTPEQQAVLREMEANVKSNNPDVIVNPQPDPVVHTAPAVTSANVAATPAYIPATGEVSDNVCPECGTMHPPVAAGEKCPNAKMNLESITDEEIGMFLSSMKNIIISQSEKNQIKDVKKLFQQSTVALAKFLEEYKEVENAEGNPTG
jgi:hypothetical protein